MPPRCQLLSGSLAVPRTLAGRPRSSPRSFTTSTTLQQNPLARHRGGDLGSHLPKHVIPQDAEIPEYPYGPNMLFKQSNKGLYGAQMIHFGNNVSPDTETKTRRNWKPNVLSKSLYSVALKKRIKLRITSKVLKTIDREGGLDEYLLKQSEHRIKELGPMGWALRWTLLQKPSVVERMRADAAALGLPQEEIDRQWPEPTSENQAMEMAAEGVASEIEGTFEAVQPWERETSDTPARTEQAVTREAFLEYKLASNAAERYLSRGLVDTKEEGIKLAFIREKERTAARQRNREAFERNVHARFGTSKTSSIHQPRLEEYQDLRRGAIEAAGGYDKWRSQLVKPETAARHAADIEKAGGEAALLAQKKADYASMIEEAEHASLNDTMAEEERFYLQSAILKANRAIKYGDKQGYVQATLEDWRERNPDAWLKASVGGSRKGAVGRSGGDAWAALVNSNRAVPSSRLNA